MANEFFDTEISTASNPTLTIFETADNGRMKLESQSATVSVIEHITDSGSGTANLFVQALPGDGTSAAAIKLHRETNTSGAVTTEFVTGDGTSTATGVFTHATGDFQMDGDLEVNGIAVIGPDTLTPVTGADDLTVEKATGAMGISLLSGDASAVTIAFGDGADSDAGRLVYTHSSNTLEVWTNGVLAYTYDANGHLVTEQATDPTATLTSTTLNDGAGSGAAIAVTSGSTDEAGSITVTAGNGTPTAGIAGQIVFDGAFTATPKCVILTAKDADAVDLEVYVSALSSTSFQISFNTAMAASEVAEFYYHVIG
jgi:YD repeat-containing protein